jgi:hypothetical protein
MYVDDLAMDFGGTDPKVRVTYTADGKAQLVMKDPNDKTNVREVPAFLYVSPDGKDWVPDTNRTFIINKYLKDFKDNPAYEAAVKSKMGLGKGATSSQFVNALNTYVENFSSDQILDYQKNPNRTSLTPLDKYNLSLAGLTQTSTSRALSTKTQAGQELDDFFFEQIGRKASAAEKKDFYDRLNKEEKAAKQTTTSTGSGTGSSKSTTTTGRGLNQADRMRIMSDVLKPVASAMSGDALVKSGGTIGKYISDLQATARDYGMPYSPDLAKTSILSQYQAGGTLTSGSLDAEKASIKTMAKTFYPNLSNLIDSGVKVSSIANQYAYYMGQTLELPDASVDITKDNYIQNALKNGGKEGAMNLNDFQISLRKDPRWAKTQNAKEEASSYANSILKSFGLVR